MADVNANLKSWSTTLASNGPSGSTAVGTGLAPNFQQIQATVRQDLATKGADIASAATTDLVAVAGLMHDITGTTTITSFGTVSAGIWKIVKFEGALTLTHNATSLILPNGANITTANGDAGIFISEGSGNWRCISWSPAATFFTTSLGADVSLTNTASYFDGPSVAQGTSGVWFVSGSVTMTDTSAAATFNAKLWDGTTVIASGQGITPNANNPVTIALSGYISSPAGDLRISVRDTSSTSGKIVYNGSGNSADSTISAIRIA